MSLRLRIALAAGVAVAIAVIAVAVSAYAGTRSQLRGQLDRSLHSLTTAAINRPHGPHPPGPGGQSAAARVLARRGAVRRRRRARARSPERAGVRGRARDLHAV